jgi:hypothetical protein
MNAPLTATSQPQNETAPARRHKLEWLWVTLYFIVLTLFMTWPLVTKMADAMAGQVGDNIYFVWMIGWLKKALFDLHVNPFNVWFLNYPEGWSLAYTEITPATLVMALPFTLLGGPTLGYNAALMLTFILSGLGMYLWVRKLTGRVDAALLAGTAYAFLPFRFAHFLIGHLNLSGTEWFPFYFWGLYDLIQERRWSWKPILLGGIALGLIGLTSQYYLYMTLIVSAFMVLCYLLFIERARIRDGLFWKRLVTMGLVSLPLILAAVAPYVLLLKSGGLPDRSLGVVRMYSASLTDFLLPSTDHFLWGKWIGSHFNRQMWVEGTLYIGLVSGALALLAWLKRRDTSQERLLKLMLWGGLLALILAMGTDLHFLGEPVELPTPSFLLERLGRPTIPLLLPGYLMFKFFPLYAKLRAWMRFGVFVLLFVCAAAGLGSAWLLARAPRRWQKALAVGLLALVLFDFYPGPYQEFTPVQARPVDTWLAAQPGQGAVAQMPFSEAEDQEQTYYTLVHGKPYIGGFFNAFPPAQYARVRPVLNQFPDAESVALLRELEVQYVLADMKAYPDTAALRQQCEALGLKYVQELGGQMIFELQVES